MKALTKLILTAAVSLIIALSLIFLLISPKLAKISLLSDELKSKKTAISTLEQQILAYKNAQSDLSKATQRSKIASALLERENLVAVVENIEKASALTGSEQIINISEQDFSNNKNLPKPILNLMGTREIPYRLAVKNDYLGTVNFIRYLEHLPQFTEITQIDLSAEILEGAETATAHTGRIFSFIDGIFIIKATK